ncbi:TPA: type II secretion system minor pseudopilin GspI [Klebsiella pneumoniae]|nr:type II secretion system minor pseudopilin GspI [Klebsiella pneumoniae]HCB1300240.1 type II secretion system minor pseudopilin GspI [Klebsiella pneumoniae]
MKREAGMTLIEVMVALVIFALAGLAVMQSTLQQTRQLGRMEEKILASWLADNQLVQLRLEKRWPALSWSETTVEAAGTRWFVRWQETWDRSQRLPQGLEITLTLANSGEITRLFLLTPGGGQ